MFGATVAIPFIICPALCMGDSDPARGYIISTILFVSGIITLLQATFGCRLPIIQGGTFAFLVPTLAILNLKGNCPEMSLAGNQTGNETDNTEVWQSRMREIQGAICVASLFQVFLGVTGIIGLMLRWITPLTITPAVTMIGISLFEAASFNAQGNWGIAILSVMFSVTNNYETSFTFLQDHRGDDGVFPVSPECVEGVQAVPHPDNDPVHVGALRHPDRDRGNLTDKRCEDRQEY